MAIGLLGVCAAGCSDDDADITPADITNLRAESTPGRIVLRWDTPADAAGTIEYIQVNYYDHRSKTDNKRLASIYADSIDIPDTRARYGNYEFTVKTVSPSGAFGQEQTVSCVSEAATPTFISRQIDITVDDLSTNAQETSEGPIANLIDDDYNTMFHTAWSRVVAGPHWLQVNLNQTISSHFRFQYITRSNPKDAPVDFDLLGSTDGNDWFAIKKFTKEEDNLPVAFAYFNSETYEATRPFSMIRISVNGTRTTPDGPTGSGPCWALSEFKFWNVEIIDPENPVDDGVED